VQPPQAPDDIAAGAEHQVVCVRENDPGARGLDVAPAHGLDRSRRADGHECGSLDGPMVERQASAPRAASVAAEELEAQHRG